MEKILSVSRVIQKLSKYTQPAPAQIFCSSPSRGVDLDGSDREEGSGIGQFDLQSNILVITPKLTGVNCPQKRLSVNT